MIKYETKKIRENMCCNGVPLLRCELSYPTVSVCESFFEEICEKCMLWAKEKLYPKIAEEYVADTDPKKRFTFGYEYRVVIMAEDSLEGYLCCHFSSCVKKRGAKDILFEKEETFAVREADGVIISQKYLNKIKKWQDEQKSRVLTVSNDEK